MFLNNRKVTSQDAFPFSYLENSEFLFTLQYLTQVVCFFLAFSATSFILCWEEVFSTICARVIYNMLVSLLDYELPEQVTTFLQYPWGPVQRLAHENTW